MQIFTSQSSQFTETKIFGLTLSRSSKINLIIMIFILLQSASILTKSFTGLLLNTNANVQYILCVDSFEQIYQDQTLEVHSNIRPQISYLKNRLGINPSIIENIVERVNIFRVKCKIPPGSISYKVDIIEKILTCKLIIICDTSQRKVIVTKYKKWKHILSLSNNNMTDLNFLLSPKNGVNDNKLTLVNKLYTMLVGFK